MGNNESDKLTKIVNLQSFSSPYSPKFILNKVDFKGKSLKQLIQEHLNPLSINSKNLPEKIENKILNISFPSLSTEDEENKPLENDNNNIEFKINPITISTKEKIIKKEKKEKKIINKIIIEDDTNKTNTTIFTTPSSLQKDINNIYNFKEIIGKGAFGIVRTGYRKKEFPPHRIYAIKSIYKKNLKKREIKNLEFYWVRDLNVLELIA